MRSSQVGPPLALLLAISACRPDPEAQTRTHTLTHTVTQTLTHTVTDGDLDPGRYQTPVARLAQVFDDKGAVGAHGVLEDHMHVDEVRYRDLDQRLLYCAYTFGVIDVSDPADPEYEAQGYEWDLPSATGRDTGCLHLDWDDADPDIVYVTHRGNVDFHPHLSVVDLGTFAPDPEDPADTELAPVLAPSLSEPGVSYEGLDAEGDLVYVALHTDGLGIYQRDPATNQVARVGGAPIVGNAYDVEVVGDIAYVLDEQQGLYLLDVSDPANVTEVSHLFVGGVDRDLQVQGDRVYIAGGGAGLVIVDASDPAAPTVLSYTDTYGTAVRLGVDGDMVAVAAWNDTRIYDVSDPAAPAIVGAARLERPKTYADDPGNERPDITARTLGVDLHGSHLYVGNWMTPYTYAIHPERRAPYLVLPEDIYYMGLGTVSAGETGTYTVDVRNDGTAPLTVTDAWVDDDAFTVTPSQVRIEPGDEAELTIAFTADEEVERTGIFHLSSDDPVQPLRKGYVVANADGIGIGDPLPYTEGTDVNTLASWSSDAAEGRVTLLAYFATF